jgi:rsbT antagonist protein RsbS
MNAALSVFRVRDVLMVSVPPDPDDDTISSLQAQILEAMERDNPRGLVLDISTVDTVDSFFARTLAETADMVRLMGGRTVIVGMQPSVAITATQLGLALGAAETALDVDTSFQRLTDAREAKG